MPAIGRSCHELRITDRSQTWRIVYYIAAEAVVILDVFSKKTQVTPVGIIETCTRRLAAYLRATAEKE